MQIMITTDTATRQSAPEHQGWEKELQAGLNRFDDELTRVVAHLSTQSGRTGPPALRCVLEAVPAGRSPIVVTEDGPTVAAAVRGALHELVHLLDGHDGQLRDTKGGPSVRHPGSAPA